MEREMHYMSYGGLDFCRSAPPGELSVTANITHVTCEECVAAIRVSVWFDLKDGVF